MDVDDQSTPAPAPSSSTSTIPSSPPFLIRTFLSSRPSTFHSLSLFEGDDTSLPLSDEYQLYAFPSSTLRDLLLTLVGLVGERFRSSKGKWAFRSVSYFLCNRPPSCPSWLAQ
jgi:hypothetical protein